MTVSGSTWPMSIGAGAGVLVVRLLTVGVWPMVGVAPARGVKVGVVVPNAVVANAVLSGVAVLVVKRLVGVGVRRDSNEVAVGMVPGVVLGTAVTLTPGSVGSLPGRGWVGIMAVPTPSSGWVGSIGAIVVSLILGVSPT